jgi:phospholipid transport system transporter-binding protein
MQSSHFYPNNIMTFATVEDDYKRLIRFFHSCQELTILFNLNTVEKCDSAGLSLLIEAKRLATHYNKNCKIKGITKHIQALAEFYGVDKILLAD